MTNMLNQSTRLPRLTKSKFLSILAVTALVLTATLSRADADGNQPEQNGLAGTWISVEFGGSSIVSFMSDGRSIFTGPINILTGNGPGGTSELASPAAGEWIRTGNREFASTAFSVLSSPTVGFTHLVKLTGTYELNRTSDELTLTAAMVAVFLPDGTPQFPPFPGGIVHFKRVVAGQ
jgi:hypothetical protein